MDDEPEDRVVVEIDVIDIRSDSEEAMDDGDAVDDEDAVDDDDEDAVEPEQEQLMDKPGSDSTSELDFQESGILANARPRKKRRIDMTPGEPVSNFTPVQGVNIHRLSVEDVERALPSLPRKKAVLLLLKPDEVSPPPILATRPLTSSVDHRPQRNSSHHSDPRHVFPLLIHPLPDTGTDTAPAVRTAYAPTTHDLPLKPINNDNAHPSDPTSAPADVPRIRTGANNNPRADPGTHLGARHHARPRRGPAQNIPRREIRVWTAGRSSGSEATSDPGVSVRHPAVVGRCVAGDGCVSPRRGGAGGGRVAGSFGRVCRGCQGCQGEWEEYVCEGGRESVVGDVSRSLLFRGGGC